MLGQADNWRRRHNVLVTDAGTLAGIGTIRSLGRAGYRVIACASDANALGLRSRFVAEALISPDYTSKRFLPWLRETVGRYAVDAIIPLEMALLAIRPAYEEFACRLPYSNDPEKVYRGLSKCDLLSLLANLPGQARKHLPQSRVFASTETHPTISEIARLGTPLFIKADAAHAYSLETSVTTRAIDVRNAIEQLRNLRQRFDRVLVQGYVPGCGVGAFFLIHQGRVLAEFMHRRLHEVPHTGGISSLRESFRHEAIRRDALAKLRAIEWEGVAMMEYRWDQATDQFTLMEMNGRFWGSLHLALHAGVDFPRMLVDALLGHEVQEVRNWPLGVRCRHTFPWELQHVWSRLKDPNVSIAEKLNSVGKFTALSLDPRIHADLLFAGDSGLYWRNVSRILPTLVRRRTPQANAPMGNPATAITP